MTDEKVGRFPFPLKGRIPNFKGAEKAAAFVTAVTDKEKEEMPVLEEIYRLTH